MTSFVRVFPAFALAALLGACSVELQNLQAARELSQPAHPSGSVYSGWRVFQDRCARCHGPDAAGGPSGPDLLPRVREMDERRFVALVLRRYDWSIPSTQSGSESAAREALIEQVLRRSDVALTMPAWEGEPVVQAHILDLHSYLSARASGAQGSGRPPR